MRSCVPPLKLSMAELFSGIAIELALIGLIVDEGISESSGPTVVVILKPRL
nr:MAG: hypothetical protein [Apis mellifera filamentous virus]